MINQTLIDSLGQPKYTITYADILKSLGDQVTDKFLYIGLFVLAFTLWFIFDGHKREDKFSIFLTSLLSSLSLAAGLVSLIFWAIIKGWVNI